MCLIPLTIHLYLDLTCHLLLSVCLSLYLSPCVHCLFPEPKHNTFRWACKYRVFLQNSLPVLVHDVHIVRVCLVRSHYNNGSLRMPFILCYEYMHEAIFHKLKIRNFTHKPILLRSFLQQLSMHRDIYNEIQYMYLTYMKQLRTSKF